MLLGVFTSTPLKRHKIEIIKIYIFRRSLSVEQEAARKKVTVCFYGYYVALASRYADLPVGYVADARSCARSNGLL